MKRLTKTTSYNNSTTSGAFQTFKAHHFRVLLDIFSYQSVTPLFLLKPQEPQIHPESYGSPLEVGLAKDLTGVVGPIPVTHTHTQTDIIPDTRDHVYHDCALCKASKAVCQVFGSSLCSWPPLFLTSKGSVTQA